MNDEEKKQAQEEIENMMNDNSENIEEIFNTENIKEEKSETSGESLNISSEMILSMFGGLVQGAYANLPEEQGNKAYVKWYTINLTTFTALNMDNRLKNLKLINIPDPIAFIIVIAVLLASTMIAVNDGKKKTLEANKNVEEADTTVSETETGDQ
ncbi:MAG: hypothetical protein IE890_00900 [Arcobacter sp.]|nr:hypothetical protein [Arcobacter sp.]